jgi:FeS assembly SUF system protein
MGLFNRLRQKATQAAASMGSGLGLGEGDWPSLSADESRAIQDPSEGKVVPLNNVPTHVMGRSTVEKTSADADAIDRARIQREVIARVKKVYDPEIPVDVWELGLIYEIVVTPKRTVEVLMTLTSPNCPAAQSLPEQVRQRAASVDGVTDAGISLVWNPPWDPSMMSEAAQLELDMF